MSSYLSLYPCLACVQRLVQRSEWQAPQAIEAVETLSIDGGKVRLRTAKGEPSQ